jgi:hypothetical protein
MYAIIKEKECMKKKLKVITGKDEIVEEAPKSLSEIITGKKATKFSKYASREDYRKALYNMNHIELCEEVMRLGESASTEKETCRNKCLIIYDRMQKPRKISNPSSSSRRLEDIIKEGK